MRSVLTLALLLACSVPCLAQLPAPAPHAPTAAGLSTTAPAPGIEPRIERIHVEDSNARIDELRIGGETRRITVQPKAALPAYEIAPDGGQRSWKVLDF